MPPEWRGETVDLICTRPGGLPEERQIHRDLHEYRVYGTEWFLGHMAVVDYLNEDPEWRVWWPLTQE